MRIILVLLLAGFALVAANPLHEVGKDETIQIFLDDPDHFTENKPTLEEAKAELKKKFQEFQQKVRDAEKSGIDKDNILEKTREGMEKFHFLMETLEREGNAFFEKLVGHGRNYLKEFYDFLGLDDKRVDDHHVEAFRKREDKNDMITKLKEVVKKIKDSIEQGRNLKDGLTMLEKIRQKLKDLNIDIGNEYLNQLKDKLRDYWQKLKDQLGVNKREANLDVFAMIQEFKQLINKDLNLEKIKAFIEKYVGENQELTEDLTRLIKENGKDDKEMIHGFLKKMIHQMIGTFSEGKNDVFEEIRDFFKDLGVEIRDRFTKFGEWVKEQYHKGLEKSKNRMNNIKILAKEFLRDSKKISKEVAEEALKFFKEYKKDLGIVFDDIELKVKEILKQD